jgi:hypothetical protein
MRGLRASKYIFASKCRNITITPQEQLLTLDHT